MLQSGEHGRLLAEIPGEGNVGNIRLVLREGPDDAKRVIAAPVVYENKMEHIAGRLVEHGPALIIKERKPLGLIVTRDYYIHRIHILIPKLKTPYCKNMVSIQHLNPWGGQGSQRL